MDILFPINVRFWRFSIILIIKTLSPIETTCYVTKTQKEEKITKTRKIVKKFRNLGIFQDPSSKQIVFQLA